MPLPFGLPPECPILWANRVFVHALSTVKRIPRTGSARPPPADRLKLYGLYKQSTEGDVEGLSTRPTGSDPDSVAETEKWYYTNPPAISPLTNKCSQPTPRDAWHAHNSLSRTEAKRQYISTLIETMHKYATTTPEARELVSELEFVWDQIKSNSVSSSASSPQQAAQSRTHGIGASYRSLETTQTPRGEALSSGGLRILRPVSDNDNDNDELETENSDDFPETRHPPLDDEALHTNQRPASDLDVRNRKWRKRIEHTLITLTAEIAALREQVEAKRRGDGRRRNGVWAWFSWLVWVALRQLVVEVALVGVLVLWGRRRGDWRVERGLRVVGAYFGERLRRVRGLGLGREVG